MKFINIVFSVLFFSTMSFALGGGSGSGNEQGNGGFVLKNIDNNLHSEVVFYDTYEAEQRYSLVPIFNHGIAWHQCSESENRPIYAPQYTAKKCLNYALDVALYILKRLEAQDQSLYSTLKSFLFTFPAEARFLRNITIFPTEDMGIGFIPPKKELKQLVVQHDPVVDEDARYIISDDLWINMNPDQQAAAILHEIIYRQALRQQDLKSSQMVRYFNALLLSGKISLLTPEKYQEIRSKTFATSW